ncbi:MAG TPA: thioredoxin domain-containing protein [Anaerolineales bacterium]|nr:thioredoxin domain-containing protein [Anaerolineales bacterium]
MSKKDREGKSKRQEFRERRRRAEVRNRWIVIGTIIVVAVLIVGAFAYYELKPMAAVQAAGARTRPNVYRNSTGDPNAPVKLEEFADFQCPYCKDFWSTTEAQVISTYVTTGKVFYTYRSAGNWVSDNVNSATGGNDTESRDSAEAAYCAADQNKFWEMHDALYTNALGEADGISFTPRRLQAIAQNIGLDMNAFNSCFNGQKYLDQVNQDSQDAKNAGIQGTPWFVLSYTVNGKTQTSTVDGNQPFNVFQQDIDQALAAAGAQ